MKPEISVDIISLSLADFPKAQFPDSNDFDSISSEESDAINRSFEEIRRGECVSFESAGEMTAHFGVTL